MGVYHRDYATGKRSWYARIRHQGQQYVRGAFSKKWQAEEVQAQMERARLLGTLHETFGPQSEGQRVRFAELAAAYLAHRTRETQDGERAASSLIREHSLVRRLVGILGEELVTEIGRGEIEGYKFARRKQGVTGATVNRELASLSGMFEHAIERRWLDTNPVRQVRRFRERHKTPRWLRPEEAEALLEECAHSPAPYLRVLVLTALYTGIRRGELFALEWRDIDLVRRRVDLTKTKTRRPRSIPLRAELVAELQQWKGQHPGPFVFALENGEPLRNTPEGFDNAVRRAGVGPFCFRDLRHTAASWMAQNGADLLQIQRILGHTTIVTTQRYAHLVPRNDQEAVATMPSLGSGSEGHEAATVAATVGPARGPQPPRTGMNATVPEEPNPQRSSGDKKWRKRLGIEPSKDAFRRPPTDLKSVRVGRQRVVMAPCSSVTSGCVEETRELRASKL